MVLQSEDQLVRQWQSLLGHRYDLERELLGAILAEPLPGAERAINGGVTFDSFDWPPHALIWCVLKTGPGSGYLSGERHADQLTVCKAIRSLMLDYGWWDQDYRGSQPAGWTWGPEALAALTDTHFSCDAVGRYAADLAAMNRTMRDAHEHLRFAGRLLYEFKRDNQTCSWWRKG